MKIKSIKLIKVAEFRNGLNFSKESNGSGCKIIGVGDFGNNFIPNYNELKEINPENIVKEEDYIKKGDLVFVRSNGNKLLVGRSLYIDKELPLVFSGFCIRLRLTTKEILPLFLLYFTKTKTFKNAISSFGSTNIHNLNQKILGDVSIPFFDLIYQKKVVNILSSLDTKIELNNKINNELESMVKTLYDYWFVQFDFPDENGNPYKLSGGKMVYNEKLKKEIPENWDVKKLNELIKVSKNSIDPSNHLEKKFKYFSIPVIDKTKMYKLEIGKEIKSNKYCVCNEDILISKLNPWFSRVVYPLDDEDMICSTEFVVCKAKDENIKNLVYIIAKSQQFIDHCIQSATGTSNSHKRVSPDLMINFKIPYNEEIVTNFTTKIDSMNKMLVKNIYDNQKIIKLRDWLLPMLMNGQVKVR